MSGFSLCNSTPLHSSFSLSLLCYKSSRFLTSSHGSRRSLCSRTPSRFSSLPQSRRAHLSSVIDKRNDGICRFAANKKGNDGAGQKEVDGFGDGEAGEDDWEDYDVGDEDQDEGMILPLEKMEKWLENKPRGFGVGKVYDTSLEDKLVDEIEQSRQAQAANLNKLKENLVKGETKKDDSKGTQNGIRVRVINLPKKKNIHRDLKSAFEGVRGILNITPAVSGNKKTKDPVCKGFAFVDFKTDVDATRFIESFSGQQISFGKVQKQIKCLVMDPSSFKSTHEEEWSGNASDQKKLEFTDSENALDTNYVVEDAVLDLWEESDEPEFSENGLDKVKMEDNQLNLPSISVEIPKETRQESKTHLKSLKLPEKTQALEKKFLERAEKNEIHDSFQETQSEEDDECLDDELDELKMEDVEQNNESVCSEKLRNADNITIRPEKISATDRRLRIGVLEKKILAKGKLSGEAELDEPDKNGDKAKKPNNKKKKILDKGKVKKAPKLGIPGSAKRLQMEEKAVLAGVFSKYAAKAASTSKEES